MVNSHLRNMEKENKEKIKTEFLKFIDDNDICVEMKSAVSYFWFDKIEDCLEKYKNELINKIEELKWEQNSKGFSYTDNEGHSKNYEDGEEHNDTINQIIKVIKQ